ncbi:MAG TPA: hypothetical protein DCM14_06780 [Clostridiales bacterium UBA8153]|nr:hypothetical protein [Clostridiales bacterium UBA8153]
MECGYAPNGRGRQKVHTEIGKQSWEDIDVKLRGDYQQNFLPGLACRRNPDARERHPALAPLGPFPVEDRAPPLERAASRLPV